jgi:hypothetical protein
VRTVKEGLSGMWLRDCGPDLSEVALAKFFTLWQMLAVVRLVLDREDALRWAWTGDGAYSSKSVYRVFFVGRSRATTSSQI